jgi:uncharacterized protein YprB with RNaseH-like and TPR domain/predicted nuclease with RNAse H fold/dephospho-CoA kinase
MLDWASAARAGLSDYASRATVAKPKSSAAYTPLLDRPAEVLFLDIETTGLSRYYDYITLVGYQIGGEYSVLLRGQDPTHFLASLAKATSVVTFNGSHFDLAFLNDAFGALSWPKHHVDLRYACRRVGLSGGQKAIEQELRITCRNGLEGVDGAAAVLLWHRYLRGDLDALRALIEYNRADVLAMTYILDHVIEASSPSDLFTRAHQLHAFCASPDTRLGLARPDATLPAPPVRSTGAVSFDSLFLRTPAEHAVVVGLDLTGSEARPSGACVTRGRVAETTTLRSDEDVVAWVLAAKPDLVSIDSPLCLPVGRTRVTDDDPMRHLGIMRESERILKRRGINVYPCLLPSMQRLTQRGIGIAATIRAHGIPVIECYPGAAQDIIGIPRKGAGEAWLKQGLIEFGLEGEFIFANDLTHDELDAITCCLVGSFHLAGLTEGIGGRSEEPMMIPNLRDKAHLVIGISGPMLAGKTTAARMIERRGFAYTRISEVIDDVLRERGLQINRENQQIVGLELHEQQGQRWLCQRAIERLGGEPSRIVVDGLRWTEDAAFFRERFGGRFILIHIKAPSMLRMERARRAGREAEIVRAAEHPVESGIEAIGDVADVTIQNDSDLITLQQIVEAALPGEGVNAG